MTANDIADLTEFDRERGSLADHLRELRKQRNVSGRTLATAAGISQAKISKIETGRVTPTPKDVEKLTSALKAPSRLRATLIEQARVLSTEFNTWRAVHRAGFGPHQDQIAAWEAAAQKIRVAQTTVVPGLLQTADYARTLIGNLPTVHGDIGAAVTARLNRQGILFDMEKNFEFVITEGALRTRLAPPQVMAAQMDRIASLSTLPNVAIGILMWGDASVRMPPQSFVAYDDIVFVETLTAELVIRDDRDVAVYHAFFEEEKGLALFGDDARQALYQIATEYTQENGHRSHR